MGDVHGHLEPLLALLRRSGLVTRDGHWAGGGARVWFVGDLTDRGPAGVGVIDLVRRLQAEAAEAGGAVECLLGNHEPLLLAAKRFGFADRDGPGAAFVHNWLFNGGKIGDMSSLTEDHLGWIAARPAMARYGDNLLVHCDSTLYLDFGETVDEVNEVISHSIRDGGVDDLKRLLNVYFRRFELCIRDGSGRTGAERLLGCFGGTQVVHGHTPIAIMADVRPDQVTGAYRYCEDRCLNVDHGLYLGGPGFVTPLE